MYSVYFIVGNRNIRIMSEFLKKSLGENTFKNIFGAMDFINLS